MGQIQPITITDFQNGIGESPFTGFAELRNLNVSENPGSCRITNEMIPVAEDSTTTTFVDNGAGVILTSASMFRSNVNSLVYRAVTFSSTGTLPTGLTTATVYYLADYAGSSTQMKVCASIANVDSNTYVNITAPGTGTHTIASVPFGVFTDMCQTSGGVVYAQDTNNRVWSFTLGNFWLLEQRSTARNLGGGYAPKGIVTWKGYLFAWRVNVLDVMNLSTGAWTSSWQSANLSLYGHHMIVGQDDTLYFGNSNYVGSILEKISQTFDPSNGATYTYSAVALDVPSDKNITYIAELGKNLALGTDDSYVYYWDRISPSFNIPSILPEKFVKVMVNANNVLYIFTGGTGKIYATNGSTIQVVKKIPDSMTGESLSSSSVSITYGTATLVGNKIYFSASSFVGTSGIYMYDISSGALTLAKTISNGNGYIFYKLLTISSKLLLCSLAIDGQAKVYSDYGSGNPYLYPYDNYQAYLISPIYRVGDPNTKASLTHFDLYLDRPLIAGQSVRISYRTSLIGSWNIIDTVSFSTNGAIQDISLNQTVITNHIQIKVELNSVHPSGGALTTSPTLNAITIR